MPDGASSTTLVGNSGPSTSKQSTTKVKFDIDLNDNDSERNQNIHCIQLQMLEKMIDLIPNLRTLNGLRVIPFSQVLLFLVYELDIKSSYDIKLLETLIATILNELDVKNYGLANIHERTQISEVKLILLRFLGKFESFNNSQPSKDVV